jgi:RNA polymerase sigma-70 factor (ECF subfamily)
MASTEDSDESLMRLIRQGSHQAFAILVRRHTDRFYATSFRITGNAAEAEDLVQDAFLKLWQRPDMWKDDKGAKFTTWFHRILVNQNIDRLRKTQRVAADNSVLPFVADSRVGPEAETAMNEEQATIERAISALPERQKTALNLCFYEGLTNAEAAEAMGVKVKALESLLMRAKAGLKEYLNRRNNPQNMGGELYGTR